MCVMKKIYNNLPFLFCLVFKKKKNCTASHWLYDVLLQYLSKWVLDDFNCYNCCLFVVLVIINTFCRFWNNEILIFMEKKYQMLHRSPNSMIDITTILYYTVLPNTPMFYVHVLVLYGCCVFTYNIMSRTLVYDWKNSYLTELTEFFFFFFLYTKVLSYNALTQNTRHINLFNQLIYDSIIFSK